MSYLMRILVLACVATLVLQPGCKEKIVGPSEIKNPREYEWRVDTLAYPGSFQTLMSDIYASSPRDAWIVGYNAAGGGKMYHYDGKQWTDVKLYVNQGGKITPGINLNAIYGFSPNDIWAVGERWYPPPPTFLDSSIIIHFDGKESTDYKLTSKGRVLQSIWGYSPTDIWAAGINTLLHFNGISWEKFPVWIPSQGIQFLSIAGTSPSVVYMIGYRNDVVQPIDTNAYFLYRFDGRQWAIVDSSIRTADPSSTYRFGEILSAIDGMLFSVGYGVYKKSGDQWQQMFSTAWGLARLRGTSSYNLFAVGEESQVYHYNGSDWYRYPQFKGIDKIFTSVWTTGEETFVIGHDGRQTYVLHGK